MNQVFVNTSFLLNRPTGEQVKYEKGLQTMTNDDMNHWYAQQFITIIEPIVTEEITEPKSAKTKKD